MAADWLTSRCDRAGAGVAGWVRLTDHCDPVKAGAVGRTAAGAVATGGPAHRLTANRLWSPCSAGRRRDLR